MAKVRSLELDQSFEAPASLRQRFYGDFKRLGRKCATRLHAKKKATILVYRVA